MVEMTIQILYNANIYTLDPAKPTATAIAIDCHHGEGRILEIGDDHHILTEFEGSGILQNLNGQTVIPGLIDAHIHLKNYALSLNKIDCELPTKVECLQRVADRARSTPPGEWILGHGWNQNDWVDGFGTAADLDQAAPQNPVYLTSKSLHTSWANSTALRIARIDHTTPNPPGGAIQRDVHGLPTGILLEGAAQLVNAVIPEPSQTEVRVSIQKAQTELLRMGITGVHDFDQPDCFFALGNLHADGALKLRVIKSIPLELLPEAIALGLQSGFGDDRLRIGSVKMFSDGALGPHTAAMLQPYENDPENRGMLLMDAEVLYEQGLLAVSNGLSLAIHAIGDRANHEVLNALERLRKIETRLRHRIEHVQILHPNDIHRLAELGIIASMQPIHATSDMQMADRYWGKRAAFGYALKTQYNDGAVMAFGSDAPVESPNPFWGIHAAVTRCRADGSPGPDGWYPDERLSLQEAIAGFTTGAAYAAGMEDRQGRLSPGFFADLLVLDTDIMNCDPAKIRDIQPAATMIGGQWAVGSP